MSRRANLLTNPETKLLTNPETIFTSAVYQAGFHLEEDFFMLGRDAFILFLELCATGNQSHK